jgi:hypothetical protein
MASVSGRGSVVPGAKCLAQDPGRLSPERGRLSPERGRLAPGRGGSAPVIRRMAPGVGEDTPGRWRGAPDDGEEAPERWRGAPDDGEEAPELFGRRAPSEGGSAPVLWRSAPVPWSPFLLMWWRGVGRVRRRVTISSSGGGMFSLWPVILAMVFGVFLRSAGRLY